MMGIVLLALHLTTPTDPDEMMRELEALQVGDDLKRLLADYNHTIEMRRRVDDDVEIIVRGMNKVDSGE